MVGIEDGWKGLWRGAPGHGPPKGSEAETTEKTNQAPSAASPFMGASQLIAQPRLGKWAESHSGLLALPESSPVWFPPR